MKHRYDRLILTGPLFGQNGIEAFSSGSETAERIAADADRPVDAGHNPSGVLAVGAIAEGELDQVGHTVVLEVGLLVFETLGCDAGSFELGAKVILANHAKVIRFDRLAVFLHRAEQLGDCAAIDVVGVTEEFRK